MITENVKYKWPVLTITHVATKRYRGRGHMITIGTMPKKVQGFFQSVQDYFSRPAFAHFWQLVLAISISHGATLERLVKQLRNSTHRTKHGEFLWQSTWDGPAVVQHIALDTLKRLARKHGGKCYFIIDETQTLKRAKKMAGVGKLFHHSSGKYGCGHTMLKVCLWYRGVIIPWGTWLYLKEADAEKQKIPFAKLTELAAQAIRSAKLPRGLQVTVLFDCYYLCPVVVKACRERKWRFIGVGKPNRWFSTNTGKHRLRSYGPNVLSRSGQWCFITGLARKRKYRLAERTGQLKSIGEVKIVFSRRRNEGKTIALVTDDLKTSTREVVADYLKRWAVELWIKSQKQQLGLGDYRVLRYRAIERHLALVDLAYACLTHVGLKTHRAQGQGNQKKCVLRLPSIQQIQTQMRQMIWQEEVQNVIKNSHEQSVIRRLEKLLAA